MDKIFIRGLKVRCIVGILPREREEEQELVLDIVMSHPLDVCAKSGDLSLSINYAAVAEAVTSFVGERKAELLETLGEELCAFILKNFKPRTVTVTLTKTEAVAHTAGVGIEMTRSLREIPC